MPNLIQYGKDLSISAGKMSVRSGLYIAAIYFDLVLLDVVPLGTSRDSVVGGLLTDGKAS
jgi:hypothetical protein